MCPRTHICINVAPDPCRKTFSHGLDPERTIGGQFCCAARRPSRCGRLKGFPLAPGGLRETARHSKPETRETAVPQADEAEAQQRAHGGTSSKSQRSRPTKATRPTHP